MRATLNAVAANTPPALAYPAFGLNAGTIVTGNTSASRQLRRDFDAARIAEGSVVWDAPDILPRDAWLRRTYQECAWIEPAAAPVLLSRWQELTLWEEAIAATTRDILLDSCATASSAREAWQFLHAYELPSDEAAFDATEDARAFFLWMRRVRRQVLDRGWITMAELPRALRERAQSGALKAPGPIAFTAFDEIAPAGRRLFEALGARKFDGADLTVPSGVTHVQRAVCHDGADELTRAAVWARRKLESHAGDEPLRLGIVVDGLGAVAKMAERIFDDILHPSWGFSAGQQAFAMSQGDSLAGSPLVAAALLTLRLMDTVPREKAAMIWTSPFLRIEPGDGARLDLELRRQKADFADLRVESVRRRFPEMAARASTLPTRLQPSQWSAAFSSLLRLAGWPGPRTLTSAEKRTIEEWKELLSEFARLDVVLGEISCGGAISRLERTARGTRATRDGADEPVQILEIAESAGSRFDALWIVGLHAGAWPPRARPNPFLPLALQRAAGLPHSSAEREAAYAKRVTERLFASAAEVVCSFPAHTGEEEQRPSPFISALPLLGELPRSDTALRRVFARAPVLEDRPADERVPLPIGTLQRGGTRVIADQSACPFRAFAIHRLRAREMDEAEVGLSALERGSAVHRALELLWKELQTQARLKALPSDELESLIRSCADSALDQFASRREPSRALDQFRRLEQSRLENLLRKWLDVESTRANFVVVHSENAQTVNIAGLNLDVRVDRVDRYDDGTHAIIDYKTSKDISTDLWQGDRPREPQLPLYATTSDMLISEVAFAQLATASVEWKGLRGAEFNEQIRSWRKVVSRLAEDFLNGRADVDPREKPLACDLCKLGALCRVRERRTLRAVDDRDD
jgi:ATP-dependent helicase/nuclease subunit B